ncbi:hypothetical protein FRC08_004493 [Ceratobasidium sp. 394]|nr:hypothetical protein FRC08_004493 [Ceratobasidium sp. 394]KAG9101963.1 hypothetical protein FS749_001012 [Ceratobasidium sp. UAMH 11750]
MAMTVHYISSKGKLAEHLIAFCRIQGHHTGANIEQTLFSVPEEAGITHKLFPHVIYLAVNAILKALPEAARRLREENAAQGYDLYPDISAYLDALESGIIAACRDSIRSMRSSDVRREEFRTTIQDGNFYSLFKTKYGEILILLALQLLCDSETRWSPTYNMIMRYLELYPFEVLQDIVSVLSVLHNAQELLSAECTPTLALALPVHETGLIQALKDLTYKFPELQHAIECGVRKLEAYVAKARDLPVYAYAMAVNPCLKFTWIDEHWSPLQRQQARVVVKEKMG